MGDIPCSVVVSLQLGRLVMALLGSEKSSLPQCLKKAELILRYTKAGAELGRCPLPCHLEPHSEISAFLSIFGHHPTCWILLAKYLQ